MPRGDWKGVSCTVWRNAISALADGEEPPVDAALVDAHVARCAACGAFRDAVLATRESLRIGVAPPMPDLAARVVKANALADRRSCWGLARVALAAVAVEVVSFSVPDLLGTGIDGADGHAARHLGAFSVAYAMALLLVVARPTRARILLPVAAVLAGALLITAVVDLSAGEVPLLGEATHLPELLSAGLLWAMARPAADRAPDGSALAPVTRRLRLVRDGGDSVGDAAS